MSNLLSIATRFRTSLFLFLCILLGGTSQAVMGPKIILYVFSTLIIGTFFFSYSKNDILKRPSLVTTLFIIFIGYVLLQLLPLPSNIWTLLPGRGLIVQSFSAMDVALPWLPIAITPGKVLSALLSILPALTLFLLAAHFADKQEIRLALWSLLVAAALSLLLGVAQVISGMKSLYLYEITNSIHPVGIFSNNNHQATLMAIAASFSIAHMINYNRMEQRSSRLPYVLCGFLTMAFLLALLLNGSSASYVLIMVVTVSLFVAFFVNGKQGGRRIGVLLCTAMVAIILVDFFLLGNTQKSFMHSLTDDGTTSRQEIFLTTWSIIKEHIIFGSGLGSFPTVYASYEGVENITASYVNHAHNDILEFIMELGLVGLGIILGIIFWWLRSIRALFKTRSEFSHMAKAGAIVLLVIFVHSLIDYPIRTLTISSIAGLSAGLLQRGSNSLKEEL